MKKEASFPIGLAVGTAIVLGLVLSKKGKQVEIIDPNTGEPIKINLDLSKVCVDDFQVIHFADDISPEQYVRINDALDAGIITRNDLQKCPASKDVAIQDYAIVDGWLVDRSGNPIIGDIALYSGSLSGIDFSRGMGIGIPGIPAFARPNSTGYFKFDIKAPLVCIIIGGATSLEPAYWIPGPTDCKYYILSRDTLIHRQGLDIINYGLPIDLLPGQNTFRVTAQVQSGKLELESVKKG